MPELTRENVEIIVSQAGLLDSDAKVQSYRIEAFSKLKNGVLGQHQLLLVQISSSPPDFKTQSFFMKSFTDEPAVIDQVLDQIFSEETHFYEKVLPVLLKTYKDEQWLPSCFLVQPKLLVFEDLRAQGYAIREDFPLSEIEIRSALSSLARFHACSILAESRLGKKLTEEYRNAFRERVYTNEHKFGEQSVIGFKTIELMAQKIGLDSNLVPGISRRVYESVKPVEGSQVPNVISHSDLWKNNLMFDQSQPPKCLLVDFQLLRYTSPSIDFGMLLYLNSTPEFRKCSEKAMFEHYYGALRDAILKSDSEVPVPTFQILWEDWRKRRIVGMVYASMDMPGLYLKKEILERLMNDPKLMEKWMFEDRFELIGRAIDEDPVYREKIKVIVSELIEEEKRLLRDSERE